MQNKERRWNMRPASRQGRGDSTQFVEYEYQVLIFDPEVQSLHDHAAPFESQGLKVHKCSSIDTALRAIEREEFDLALVDQCFPAAHGLRVMRHLMRYNPRTPFLVLTNQKDNRVYQEAMAMGALDYLEKPVPVEQLNRLIQDYLGGYRVPHPSIFVG
jgi:DNA-binding NtrC family response regulator